MFVYTSQGFPASCCSSHPPMIDKDVWLCIACSICLYFVTLSKYDSTVPDHHDDSFTLDELLLSGNDFTGTITKAICDSRAGGRFFDLQNLTVSPRVDCSYSVECCDLKA